MACRGFVFFSVLAVAVGRVQRGHNPGVGMQPDGITPFAKTFMDGYSLVACAKDYMLLHGDKHGDGKFSYKLGPVANVSIVHYMEMMGRQEQEPMTHAVCYGFCRTIPGMSFFGINNGRDCYCMPYFKQMAGDSSDCDAPCDGEPTTMCGGKAKSSIFEMHSCGSTAEDLAKANSVANTSLSALSAVQQKLAIVGEAMQTHADGLQKVFGKVGDQTATANLQAAKAFVGTVVHSAEVGEATMGTLGGLSATAAFGPLASVEATEELTVSLIKATDKADLATKDLTKVAAQAIAPETNTSVVLYYSAMYFVDKQFEKMPSTCGGEAVGSPMVGDFAGCAAACENEVGKCVGFSYMEAAGSPGMEGLCFMFSTLKSLTYYTGCGGVAAGFLETRRNTIGAAVTKCAVKFSEFEGTSIAPDKSGKCKDCLKTATKADRCFA